MSLHCFFYQYMLNFFFLNSFISLAFQDVAFSLHALLLCFMSCSCSNKLTSWSLFSLLVNIWQWWHRQCSVSNFLVWFPLLCPTDWGCNSECFSWGYKKGSGPLVVVLSCGFLFSGAQTLSVLVSYPVCSPGIPLHPCYSCTVFYSCSTLELLDQDTCPPSWLRSTDLLILNINRNLLLSFLDYSRQMDTLSGNQSQFIVEFLVVFEPMPE